MPQMYPLPCMTMYVYIIMLVMAFTTYIYFLVAFKFPTESNYYTINFKW